MSQTISLEKQHIFVVLIVPFTSLTAKITKKKSSEFEAQSFFLCSLPLSELLRPFILLCEDERFREIQGPEEVLQICSQVVYFVLLQISMAVSY